MPHIDCVSAVYVGTNEAKSTVRRSWRKAGRVSAANDTDPYHSRDSRVTHGALRRLFERIETGGVKVFHGEPGSIGHMENDLEFEIDFEFDFKPPVNLSAD